MFNTLNSVTKLLNIFKSNLFVVLCLQTWSTVDFLMPYMFPFASSFSKPVLKFCRCLWSKCLSISSQGISCHIVVILYCVILYWHLKWPLLNFASLTVSNRHFFQIPTASFLFMIDFTYILHISLHLHVNKILL